MSRIDRIALETHHIDNRRCAEQGCRHVAVRDGLCPHHGSGDAPCRDHCGFQVVDSQTCLSGIPRSAWEVGGPACGDRVLERPWAWDVDGSILFPTCAYHASREGRTARETVSIPAQNAESAAQTAALMARIDRAMTEAVARIVERGDSTVMPGNEIDPEPLSDALVTYYRGKDPKRIDVPIYYRGSFEGDRVLWRNLPLSEILAEVQWT